jgi:hypothetical protein
MKPRINAVRRPANIRSIIALIQGVPERQLNDPRLPVTEPVDGLICGELNYEASGYLR